ncbi:piRNA biogenesis protein EXD1-like [Haliotis rubra]|uniref:piRNA biogenesis protein EXD1-like n=1 Tax=Haliotis rubra TaxID=36100 RepID=UPI001EE51AD8|nr:piRNA biogenesis protein EXD1-like [Haliotis rubra]
MAEDGVRHKVVDNIDDSVKAVGDLLQESVVAVNCEGIHLGKKGPLTLLQVAKLDGFVYLFNVFVEPKVFTEGRLKSFLENKDIIKVFHACSHDSAALKCQYDVMLVNVFDVKAAQYVIEKSEGRQLPSHRKLLDLCRLYTDVTSLEGKEEVQAKWYKADGAFWAKKELSPEMVDYACADVRILLPGVYDKLKRALDEKELWAALNERVEFELNFRWNENVKYGETKTTIKNILRQFSTKYTSNVELDDITSEDDIQALKQIPIREVGQFPDTVMKLKSQILKKEMDELEQALTEKADSFVPMGWHFGMLDAVKSSPDPAVSMAAGILKVKLVEILKTDLITKYDVTTPGKYISESEKIFLRRLPSTGTNPAGHPVLSYLYNVVIDSDVEEIETLRQKFRREGSRFRLNHADLRRCKNYISAPGVPERLKTKANAFLNELKAGVVESPKTRPRNQFR